MKKVKSYIVVIFSGLLLYTAGCDNPAPTQLVQDNPDSQNPVQVQVLTKDTSNEYYSNGFDTTGVATNYSGNTDVITISGVKTTAAGITTNNYLAQAIFFDRSKPIFTSKGKMMGYGTRNLGEVRFNSQIASIIPYYLRFNDSGVHVVDSLGVQYLRSGSLNPFGFVYNSSVSFQLIKRRMIGMGRDTISFDIPTPDEITGSIDLSGSKANQTLNAVLHWNKSYVANDTIEVILGVKVRGTNISFPLYMLEAKDSGKLTVPPKLLNGIPFANYDRLVFTFVRRLESQQNIQGNDLTVLSQSIHSFIIKIP